MIFFKSKFVLERIVYLMSNATTEKSKLDKDMCCLFTETVAMAVYHTMSDQNIVLSILIDFLSNLHGNT